MRLTPSPFFMTNVCFARSVTSTADVPFVHQRKKPPIRMIMNIIVTGSRFICRYLLYHPQLSSRELPENAQLNLWLLLPHRYLVSKAYREYLLFLPCRQFFWRGKCLPFFLWERRGFYKE